MSAASKAPEPPLVEVLAQEHGRSVSPAQEAAQHPAASQQVATGEDADDETTSADEEPAPGNKVPLPPPRWRGFASRAMSATSRAIYAALRFVLRLVVFVVFATLRLLQLAAFALTAVGLPYTLSGPATVLALLATATLLALKVPFGGVPRTLGRVCAFSADAALLALAGAMLADHCGCRGGAPLPAPVYKAVRQVSLSSLHLVHATKLKPAELAYRAYCTACDLIC